MPIIRVEGKEIMIMLDVMDKRQNKRLLATERGEPQRSGGEPNGGANNLAADSPAPDPEVLARPQRRRFTPAYKARVVEEAQRCDGGHVVIIHYWWPTPGVPTPGITGKSRGGSGCGNVGACPRTVSR